MAGDLDLLIYQGATFTKNLLYKDSDGNDVDLSGFTARMQIREDYETPVLIELTTQNGRITLNNPTGNIRLSISAEDTEELSFARARYDLELVDNGVVKRLVQGRVRLDREVTR